MKIKRKNEPKTVPMKDIKRGECFCFPGEKNVYMRVGNDGFVSMEDGSGAYMFEADVIPLNTTLVIN